jgi:hypothetical protein
MPEVDQRFTLTRGSRVCSADYLESRCRVPPYIGYGFIHSRPLPSSAKREWLARMPRTRKPSWVRLVVALLVVVGVSVGLVVALGPFGGIVIGVAAVVGVSSAVSRRSGSRWKRKGQGWRMHHSGEYRWWDGAKWNDPPPGETPREIGPEIEW